MSKLYLAILSSVILFALSCANIKSIGGGPDDKRPAEIVWKKSNNNFQKNFSERSIKITFDEWVKLVNPSQNIIISPKLKYFPDIKIKSKTLEIKFSEKEVLRENTTYSIYLGDAIQDITNQNVSRNIRFVFSTGPEIDSAFILGNVKDAFTGKPVNKILVSLYSNLSDSAFLLEAPNYFSFTDTSGFFKIENVKPGVYKLFGLLDKNQNYYYDSKSESIAFQMDSLDVPLLNNSSLKLYLSQEQSKTFIKDKKIIPGKLNVIFNQENKNAFFQCPSCKQVYSIHSRDSFIIWYTSDSDVTSTISYDDKIDTIELSATNSSLPKFHISLKNYNRQIIENDDIVLNWLEPIEFIDTSKIQLSNGKLLNVRIDTNDSRRITIVKSGVEDKFKIYLDSNAIVGRYSLNSLRDTLNFQTVKKTSLSVLLVQFDSLDLDHHYIFQLVQGDKIIESRIFTSDDNYKELKIDNLVPGIYKVRLILDENNNSRWDPGNYSSKMQPEKVWNWDMNELRANWDMTVKFKL